MLPSTNRTKHGTPPSGHCQLLLDSPREEFLRCKTLADLEASLIVAVKRKVAGVTRRLAEKNRGTEATPALAQPDADDTNSKDDVKPAPAVPNDERDDASKNSRSVQQHNSDQTPAHPEINDDKLVKDIISWPAGDH